MKKIQEFDLNISHHRIQLRADKFSEEKSRWGEKNVAQGAVLHESDVTFDPIIDGAFLAKIVLSNTQEFTKDENSKRIIRAPFKIKKPDYVYVSSSIEEVKVNIGLISGNYSIFFEICETDEVDEVFYKITFLSQESNLPPQYLIDDDFGGVQDENLVLGFQ